MDKFYGINRVEIISTEHSYGVDLNKENPQSIASKNPTKQAPNKNVNSDRERTKNKKLRGFTFIRYGICAVLLLTCFLGRFLALGPLSKASTFIKDELSRDTIAEITEMVNESNS